MKLTARVRRIGGQVTALERALADHVECGAVLQQLAAVRGAVNGLVFELLESHLREHVAPNDRATRPNSSPSCGAATLPEVSTLWCRGRAGTGVGNAHEACDGRLAMPKRIDPRCIKLNGLIDPTLFPGANLSGYADGCLLSRSPASRLRVPARLDSGVRSRV